MKRLKSNDYEHNLDRLSALPNSLIHEILSFLKMRDVVRTSRLSKRWRYLWTTIPCLRFDEFCEDPIKIRNFVSRALTLWRGNHLRKFSIDVVSMDTAAPLSSDMDLWVLFAVQRNVEESFIGYRFSVNIRVVPFYCPPQCLYECSSFRKLSLIRCNLRIHGGVKWDCLNSLDLHSCCFTEDVLNQIFASCTQLETVWLNYSVKCGSLSIRSISLKKLSVYSDCDGNLESVMTICAPNLVALQFKGKPFKKYLLTNFSSLTEVLLDFKDHCRWSGAVFGAVVEEALCRILPAIKNVVTVKLSAPWFKILGALKGKYAFSPLLNVKSLRIGGGLAEISELAGLLEYFPNLKTLIIDWVYDEKLFEFNCENCTISEANILKSNLLQLRTVEINRSRHQASIIQFIECLLKHAAMIEKMVIQKREFPEVVDDQQDMFLAAQKLVSLQRSFPSVELILCKCNINDCFNL